MLLKSIVKLKKLFKHVLKTVLGMFKICLQLIVVIYITQCQTEPGQAEHGQAENGQAENEWAHGLSDRGGWVGTLQQAEQIWETCVFEEK